MEKRKLFMALACATTMIFTGCKDDDVPAYEFKQQGSVKGTITGTTADNTSLNETFNFTSYNPGDPSFYGIVSPSQDKKFYIKREDPNTGGYLALTFTIAKNATEPSFVDGSIYYIKETDKLVALSMKDDDSEGDDSNTFTISSFSFDEKTGIVKGKYVLTGSENTIGKSITVSGDFDVVARKLVQ